MILMQYWLEDKRNNNNKTCHVTLRLHLFFMQLLLSMKSGENFNIGF